MTVAKVVVTLGVVLVALSCVSAANWECSKDAREKYPIAWEECVSKCKTDFLIPKDEKNYNYHSYYNCHVCCDKIKRDAPPDPLVVGCKDLSRELMADPVEHPTVAGCGPLLNYKDAMAQEQEICAEGWRACTAEDMIELKEEFAPENNKWWMWIKHDDPTEKNFWNYDNLECQGKGKWSHANLAGTHACTNGGNFPEGWRLAVNKDWWHHAHQSSSGCIPHAAHLCGFPGKHSQEALTACCKIPWDGTTSKP